jgi:predicted O-methyltransferase YrrM
MSRLKQAARGLVRRLGYELVPAGLASDMVEPAFRAVHDACAPFTMGTVERLYALHKAVHYLEQRSTPGDVVECGVWRGGSAMACALTLRQLGSTERLLHLYDTFAGMSEPGARDVDFRGRDARATWEETRDGDGSDWCRAGVEDVRRNLESTGYPAESVRLVVGKVEDTLPAQAPERIALLRLDTDWYESTYHELVHLFPRLSPGGVLIVDDYGYWRGAREATDQYFREAGVRMLLTRLDHSARMGIKVE